MNDPFAQVIRRAASALLPEKAFLRRDRQDGLFVTNACRLIPDRDWISVFTHARFIVRDSGGLLRLWPDESWLFQLEEAFSEPPDHLSRTLVRFAGLAPSPESIALFALGVRILDGDPVHDYESRLRRCAAVALRNASGGGLYACSLINHLIRKECDL